MTQKEEHVLDPASAVARVPLKLTKRFTEKLNHDGIVERSESQENSVTNGPARMPSFESINAIFGVRGNPTPGVTQKVTVMDELERFLQGLPSEQSTQRPKDKVGVTSKERDWEKDYTRKRQHKKA